MGNQKERRTKMFGKKKKEAVPVTPMTPEDETLKKMAGGVDKVIESIQVVKELLDVIQDKLKKGELV